MAKKSLFQTGDEIGDLIARSDQLAISIKRKLIAGESTAGDRAQDSEIQKRIAELRAAADAAEDEAFHRIAQSITESATRITSESRASIDTWMLALKPNAAPTRSLNS